MRTDLDALDIAAGYCPDHAKELIWDAVAELRAARESERRANSMYAAMRAELRAAREVVEAARQHWRVTADGCATCRAMAAYDQAVTP